MDRKHLHTASQGRSSHPHCPQVASEPASHVMITGAHRYWIQSHALRALLTYFARLNGHCC